MNDLKYYCQKFSQLKVSSSRKRGNAQYKPILVLSVIDLIAQGIITNNQIFVSDELIETFDKYWKGIGSQSYKGGLHYPFLHLQSEDFWHIKFKSSFDGLQPKTTSKLKKAVEYAYLDNELFLFLQDEIAIKELTDTLVAVFFPDDEKQLEEILNINQTLQDDVELEKTLSASINLTANPKWSFRKIIVRNAFFRKSVVSLYENRCAFCGLKVTKGTNQNIVDGAHIKPFAQFHDSRIINGISLCKNHHLAFDRGWFAVDEQYNIIVSTGLQEVSPHAKPMRDFHGEQIIEQYFPEHEALQWHRQNIFQV